MSSATSASRHASRTPSVWLRVASPTVPPGKGLPVWRGKTASQQLRDSTGQVIRADNKGNSLWLEGGAEQLVIDPKHLDRKHLGPREFTGWGYDEFGEEAGLIGVPVLQHNWRE